MTQESTWDEKVTRGRCRELQMLLDAAIRRGLGLNARGEIIVGI